VKLFEKLPRYAGTAILFAILPAMEAPMQAQTTEANLAGIVYDSSRSVVQGASINLVSKDRGITRTTTSNDAGAYQFPFVQPGTYDIEVSAPGFKSLKQEALSLSAAQNARVDLTLELGSVNETLSVTAEVAAINTGSAEISAVINSRSIEELPSNGRQFWAIPQLAPGVTPPVQGSGNSLRGGFNVSGSGDSSNYFILNGLDNNDSVTATPLFRPSVDAIEEMTALTGLYPAQYGFLSGGQVIMTIKSGTDQFHGSAFDFLRNSAVATARNFFQTSVPFYNRNQFGATLGGPIQKSKTFFFFAYEGLRSHESIPITSTVPTAAMKTGDFSNLLPKTVIKDPNTGLGFTGNIIPPSRISPVGTALLALYPNPTLATAAGSVPANNHFWNPTRPEQDDTYSFKVDHTFRAADTAFVSVNRFRQSSHEPIGRTGCNGGSQLPNLGCQLTYNADVYGLSETHIFSPTLINQFYAGFSLGEQPYAADGTKIDFWGQFNYHPRTAMPAGLPTTGIPNTSITSYTSVQAGSQYRRDPRAQITDTLSWTKGQHGIRMGYSWSDLPAAYIRTIPVSGVLTFTSTSAGPTSSYAASDVLLGLPASTSWTDKALLMHFISSSTAAFIHDDYKITSRLSLNLGLRWELNPPLRERNNLVNSFDVATGKPVVANSAGYGDHVYNYDWRDFAPRIGFAWQPFGGGKTVVRGGFGSFYNRIPVGSQSFLIWGQYPYSTVSTYTSSKTQPVTLATPFPANNAVTTISVTGVDPNFKNPRSYQWSLAVQRQLPMGMVADVAYVGSKSDNQLVSRSINQSSPGAGTPAEVNARRPYPAYGSITYYKWDGAGNYHSLQSKLSRRFARGLSFTASYTYSKSIDNTNARTNQFNPSTGRGPSSFDIGQRFVVSGVYDLPVGQGKPWLSHGFASYVLGGWQLSPLFQAQSGQPMTSTLSGNFSNTGGDATDRPDVVGNPNQDAPHTPLQWFNTSAFRVPIASGQPGATYSYGNAGVGIIRGPGLVKFDVSLVRNLKVKEKLLVQFRAEFFNLFNHTNFGLPGVVANTSTFGVISTANDPRLSQFALKLSF
jgi:hypothetical protein